eukprot:13981234-Ditylum_brightwellii.AAC.1
MASAGDFDVIVHGCNCFNTMGAGIALKIKRRFPAAYRADLATKKGCRQKLGTFSQATITLPMPVVQSEASTSRRKLTIINAYTQYNYRGRGRKTDYDAIMHVFRKIKRDFSGKRIGYPLIGAGLGGGDWDTISNIIDSELDGEDHTLVKFEK